MPDPCAPLRVVRPAGASGLHLSQLPFKIETTEVRTAWAVRGVLAARAVQ